jgi:hypothetical protein
VGTTASCAASGLAIRAANSTTRMTVTFK